MSRARSCVSQVKPSPMRVPVDQIAEPLQNAVRSPVDQAPLMNCTTPQRRPCPSMRSSRPKAAVRFALAGAGVDDQQALLDGLARDLGILHRLALRHLGGVAGVICVFGHFAILSLRAAGEAIQGSGSGILKDAIRKGRAKSDCPPRSSASLRARELPFQLLFPSDRCRHIGMQLEIDQELASVTSCAIPSPS